MRVRFPGSALIDRGDNLAYIGNTSTPQVRIKPGGDYKKIEWYIKTLYNTIANDNKSSFSLNFHVKKNSDIKSD